MNLHHLSAPLATLAAVAALGLASVATAPAAGAADSSAPAPSSAPATQTAPEGTPASSPDTAGEPPQPHAPPTTPAQQPAQQPDQQPDQESDQADQADQADPTPDPPAGPTTEPPPAAPQPPALTDPAPPTAQLLADPANQPPVAVDDSYFVFHNESISIPAPGFMGNDYDPDGDSISAILISGFDKGASLVSFNDQTGYFGYGPDGSFLGEDTLVYQLVDEHGAHSNLATITVTVGNRPPTATADTYSVHAGDTLTVPAPGLLGNDGDPDGDALAAITQSGFSHASAAVLYSQTGALEYTPEPGFFGSDSMTYLVHDEYGASSSPVTVTVNVTNTVPSASDDLFPVAQGDTLVATEAQILANDTDADGDPLSVASLDPNDFDHGTASIAPDGSLHYTPDPGFLGVDTATYRASDGLSQSMAATISVVVAYPPNQVVDDEFTMDQGTSLDIAPQSVLDNDVLMPWWHLVTCGSPTVGVLHCNLDGTFDFTPPADFSGDVTFPYTVAPEVQPDNRQSRELLPAVPQIGDVTGTVTVHVLAEQSVVAHPDDPTQVSAAPAPSGTVLPDTGAAPRRWEAPLGFALVAAGVGVLARRRRTG